MMSVRVFALLIFFLTCACSVHRPVALGCADPRVTAIVNTDECHVSTTPFRAPDGKVSDAQLISVTTGYVRDIDTAYPRNHYFAIIPGNKFIDLHDVDVSRSFFAEGYVYTLLGRQVPLCCIDRHLFYERYLEQKGDKLCSAFVMRFPYQGTYVDCSAAAGAYAGSYKDPESFFPVVSGSVSMASGSEDMAEAERRICRNLETETGKGCIDDYHPSPDRWGFDSAFPIRNPEARLQYVFVARGRPHGDRNSLFEFRAYRVDAVTGAIVLLEKTGGSLDQKYRSDALGRPKGFLDNY